MQPGQSVQVSLDAFPDKTFIGVIDSLSPASGAKFSLLPAENATGIGFTKIVQRIPVRIRLDLSEEEAHATGLKCGRESGYGVGSCNIGNRCKYRSLV